MTTLNNNSNVSSIKLLFISNFLYLNKRKQFSIKKLLKLLKFVIKNCIIYEFNCKIKEIIVVIYKIVLNCRILLGIKWKLRAIVAINNITLVLWVYWVNSNDIIRVIKWFWWTI